MSVDYLKVLPSRFRKCRPWNTETNLVVIFKQSDEKITTVKGEFTADHAQYTDYHSLIPALKNSKISTAEIMDLVTKGLARFDNMFLFHYLHPEDSPKRVTNSLYSSYNMFLPYTPNSTSINKFIEKVLGFIKETEEVETSCYLYILIIRSLYLLIAYNIKVDQNIQNLVTIKKINIELIKKLFKSVPCLDKNIYFLTLRFYQCIVLIQTMYIFDQFPKESKKLVEKDVINVYKEFKLLYNILLIESSTQVLPRHLLTNDDEEVPFLDILNRYIYSLLQKYKSKEVKLTLIERTIEVSYFALIIGGDFATIKKNIDSIFRDSKELTRRNLPEPDDFSIKIKDYLIRFYDLVNQSTYFGMTPQFVIDLIIEISLNYEKEGSIIRKFLSDDVDAFEKVSESLITNIDVSKTNNELLVYLQYDIVKLFQDPTSPVEIGEKLKERMKDFENEDQVKACQVSLDNSSSHLEYTFHAGNKIIFFDTSDQDNYKFICLVDIHTLKEGQIYDSQEKNVIRDSVLLKKHHERYKVLKELKWLKSFENVFSLIEMSENVYYLSNTELTISLDKKEKTLLLHYETITWSIEEQNYKLKYQTRYDCRNKFLYKLTSENGIIKYLIISAPIQNYDDFDEFKDPIYKRKDLYIPQVLYWKQKFLKTRGNTSMLPGRKTGSIICSEPSELVSNPYLFHQYTKYSLLYFFNNVYNDDLHNRKILDLLKKNREQNHFELWYLYTRTIGIQYKECSDDLRQLHNFDYSKEERTCLDNLISTLRFDFYKKFDEKISKKFDEKISKKIEENVSFEFDLNLSLDYDDIPKIPKMFESVNYAEIVKNLESLQENEENDPDDYWPLIIDTLQKVSGNTGNSTTRRDQQIVTLKKIKSSNIDETNRTIYELPMGFGKTSSVIPCLLHTCSIKNIKKIVIIVPYNLVSVVRSQIITFSLYFSIVDIVCDLAELHKIDPLGKKVNSTVCVCSDYDYKSFIVDHSSIEKPLFGMVIVDEVDSLFDNVKTDFFKSSSFLRVVDIYDKVFTLDLLYHKLQKEYKFNKEMKYIKLPDLGTVKTFVLKASEFENVRSRDWFNKFLIVLVTVNTMRYELHYGLSKDTKRLFAVPYLNAKMPSPTNQFSDPDMVFVLTYLSYTYCSEDDIQYIVKQYNTSQSIKDCFGRSKSGSGEKILPNHVVDKRRNIVKRLVMFVFESNFEYANEMKYTSMIDATSSFYTEKLIGFSGTITLVNPYDGESPPLTTMVEYTDIHNAKRMEFVPYEYEKTNSFPPCKEKNGKKIKNHQLCFLDKIEILQKDVEKVKQNVNIIYLDIGDTYLYESSHDKIKDGIIKDCCETSNPKNYDFSIFKEGKLVKSKTSTNENNPVIYFFDHVSCRGTDYKFDENKEYCIVITISLRKVAQEISTDNLFSEFLQALYRVRQLHMYFDNEEETFLTMKKLEKLEKLEIRKPERLLQINSIYISFIHSNEITQRPSRPLDVVSLLLKKEKELFSEREAYAKEQYLRYLKRHIILPKDYDDAKELKFVIEDNHIVKNNNPSLVLKLSDISRINGEAQSENKNQLQNKSNVEIPKNGDITAFDIDDFQLSKPVGTSILSTDQYSFWEYHKMDNFTSNIISLYTRTSRSVIKLSDVDLIYFVVVKKNTFQIYIFPFVFLSFMTKMFKNNLYIFNMFGQRLDMITTLYNDNYFDLIAADLKMISVVIQLFNNVVPYQMTLDIMNKISYDKYLFEKLSRIDYLYPFTMVTYNNDDSDPSIDGSTIVQFPLPPLTYRKTYSIPRSFEVENYPSFQFLTNTKTSSAVFIASKEVSTPYYNAVIHFIGKDEYQTVKNFYDSALKSKLSYNVRNCINDEECEEILTQSEKTVCLIKKLSGKNDTIVSKGQSQLSFKSFFELPWNEIIQKENGFYLETSPKLLLLYLISQYNHVVSSDDRIECSKLSTTYNETFGILETLSNIKKDKFKEYFDMIPEDNTPSKLTEEDYNTLFRLTNHICLFNENICEDALSLPSPDEVKKLNGIGILITQLKDLGVKLNDIGILITQLNELCINPSLDLHDKIVRYLYQFKIDDMFQEYYTMAIDIIEDLKDIVDVFLCTHLFFPISRFNEKEAGDFVNEDNVLKLSSFFSFYFSSDLKKESSSDLKKESSSDLKKESSSDLKKESSFVLKNTFLGSKKVSIELKKKLLNKFIDLRWKITCEIVNRFYSKSGEIQNGGDVSKRNLKTINSLLFDLNDNLMKRTWPEEFKIDWFEDNPNKEAYSPLMYEKAKENVVSHRQDKFKGKYASIFEYIDAQKDVDNTMTKLLYTLLSLSLDTNDRSKHSIDLKNLGILGTGILGFAGLMKLHSLYKKNKLSKKIESYIKEKLSRKSKLHGESESRDLSSPVVKAEKDVSPRNLSKQKNQRQLVRQLVRQPVRQPVRQQRKSSIMTKSKNLKNSRKRISQQ